MYAQEQIKPYGAEGSKRSQVERMFNNIAHSYDLLNHTLSLGIDRRWRSAAIGSLKPYFQPAPAGQQPEGISILDVATGTGDLAIMACRQLPSCTVVGCDISDGMMDIGRRKVAEAGLSHRIQFQREDCSCLSFADSTFDAVVSAFALRNFEDLDRCLSEMRRVLRPGGRLSVIDLCTPVSFPMKQLFWLYRRLVMPLTGRLISRDDTAYTYLPQSMAAIPQADAMQQIISKAGFRNTNYRRLAFGMCILYTAEK